LGKSSQGGQKFPGKTAEARKIGMYLIRPTVRLSGVAR